MDQGQILTHNLKTLLWLGNRNQITRSYSEYIQQVSQSCALEYEEFKSILQGNRQPTPPELMRIVQTLGKLGFDLDSIESKPLVPDLIETAGAELLDLNIQYLIRSVACGKAQHFADAIGVNISTVNRWLNRKTRPDTYAKAQIADYFGFTSQEEIITSFVFLGLDPITDAQKRMYCQNQIDLMDKDAFLKIYPALIKLLK